jgi:uncharacterized protein (AIM24 family)
LTAPKTGSDGGKTGGKTGGNAGGTIGNGAGRGDDGGMGPNVPLARAGALVAAQQFGDAEAEIVRVLAAAPDDLRALNLLALVRFKLGRLEEAQATYGDIARAAPEDSGAHRNLGLIALKLGRPAQARPALETAVRLAPSDTRAWSYLGYAYAKQGESSAAAAAFRKAGQEALAVEVEQGAQPRDEAAAKAPPAKDGAKDGTKERAGEGEDDRGPSPVALAPPLPPLSPRGPLRPDVGGKEAASPSPAAPLASVEANPVPLLTFVLSRLGQAAAPPRPTGALHLRVSDEVHVRADAVLAGTGDIAWAPAMRRAQGRLTGEPLGGAPGAPGAATPPRAPFFRLTGAGELWVAGAGTNWLPVALADDVLYVREDRVLAFEGSLSWEAGSVRGAALRMLQFRGRGTVALELDEAPVAIKVTDDRPTLLAGARLVGWVGRLVPHGQPNGAGSGVPVLPFQISCQGEGVVLLDAGGRR